MVYSKSAQGFQNSKNIGHPTLGRGGKKTFKRYLKILTWLTQWFIKPKLLCGDFTPFIILFFKFWDHFFSLLFPKESESLKILDIQHWEVGGKKTFKHYLKSEHTDRQTHTQTNTWKFWLIKIIGPEGWCFKKASLTKGLFHFYNCIPWWIPRCCTERQGAACTSGQLSARMSQWGILSKC